jgi:hypothetical protein
MSGAEEQVRRAVRAMLPTLDLNTTTERQIREMLAQQHGFAVDTPATKKIVKVAHANLAEVE